MASSLSQKIEELKRVIRLHTSWLIYATLGKSALTKAEIKELEQYGKLPMDKTLDLVDKSYLLGRLRATLKRGEFKDLSYEEVGDKVAHAKLSPLEELVLEQVKLRAGQSIKKLTASVADTTVDAIQHALGSAIADDRVRTAVATETALAVVYRKSAQQLASELASKLQTLQKRNWTSVARTELHAAKVQGAVQAILNRVDIYANSEGAESTVSIVPSSVCCADCRHHYLDDAGNPRVFKLQELLNAGSNADEGVDHSRQGKRHIHWKTTLPPLHPNCGCQIHYVPPGYSWRQGKLELLNKSLFEASLMKATAGVSGGISPTVKPAGPSGNTPTSAKPPGMPSLPGAAAPGNTAGPGRPPSVPKPPGMGSGQAQHSPCPFGGGDECVSHGGNGAAVHKSGGSIMKKHQEAMARGAKPVTKEAQEQQEKQLDAQSSTFNQQPHPDQKIVDHLAEGEIGAMKRLGGANAGKNASFKVTIVGNGSGLMKPPVNYDDYVEHAVTGEVPTDPAARKKIADTLTAPGSGTIPPNMNPKCEAGAYHLGKSLGIKVPVTTLRNHDGADGGPRGLTSVMHWQDKAVDVDKYAAGVSGANYYEKLMKTAPPEHRAKMHEQLSELAVADVIWNNGDRHWGNIMFDPETHDVVPIDHGTTFSNGMAGGLNMIAHAMTSSGVAMEVSPRLQQKLKNSSLADTMRALDEAGLPEYAKAQTFLRQRYVSYLQDTFDHVPFDRIRGSQCNTRGESRCYDEQWEDAGPAPALANYWMAEAAGTTPHQRFESWAKGYMTKAASDPQHPDHADAKKLLEIGPLRSTAHIMGTEPTHAEALKKHFDSIPDYDFDVDQVSASRIKAEKPNGKKFHSEVAARQAPDVDQKGTAVGKKKKTSDVEVDVDLSGLQSSSIELDSDDIEVLDDDPDNRKTGLHLDMDEFLDDEIDSAFDRIKAKKSLILAQPNSKFPVDTIFQK